MIPIDVQERIGKTLRGKLEELNLRNVDIAERYHQDMGFGSVSSAVNWLSKINRGQISGSPTRVKLSPDALSRLSVYISALGIDEDSSLVTMVESLESRFEYSHATDAIERTPITAITRTGPKNARAKPKKGLSIVQRSLAETDKRVPCLDRKYQLMGKALEDRFANFYSTPQDYASCHTDDLGFDNAEQAMAYVELAHQGYLSGNPQDRVCRTQEQKDRVLTYAFTVEPNLRHPVHNGLRLLLEQS
jgi:hypothetical protein